MVKTYEIAEEVIIDLERHSYEVESLKAVIKSIISDISTTDAVLKGPAYNHYQKKYQDAFAEYEILKQEVLRNVLPEDVRANMQDWNIDFGTGILTVNMKEN